MNIPEIASRYGISESKFRIEFINCVGLEEELREAGYEYGKQRLFFGKQIGIIEKYFGQLPPKSL